MISVRVISALLFTMFTIDLASAYDSEPNPSADDAHNHDGSHPEGLAQDCGANYLLPHERARLGSHSFMILGPDGPSHVIAEHRSGTPPHNYQFLLRVRLDPAEMATYNRLRSESKTLPAFTTIDFDEKREMRGRTFFCLQDLPKIFGAPPGARDEFDRLFPIKASLQKDADHEGSFAIAPSVVLNEYFVLERKDVSIIVYRYLPAYLAQNTFRAALKKNPDELLMRIGHAPIRFDEGSAQASKHVSYGFTDGAISGPGPACPADFYLKKEPLPQTIHSFLLLAELGEGRVLATHYYDHSPQNFQTVLELKLSAPELDVFRRARANTQSPPLLQTRVAAKGGKPERNFTFCMADLATRLQNSSLRFEGTLYRESRLDDYRLGEPVGTVALESAEIKVLVNRPLLSFLDPRLVAKDVLGTRALAVSPAIPEGFVNILEVIPKARIEMRYFSDWNFLGRVVPGYEANKCYVTVQTAKALAGVQADAEAKGYSLLFLDCYRPQRAVTEFVRWVGDREDQKMKNLFYPDEDKTRLIERGYIDARSGHSRGSTVDLTLIRNEALSRADFRETALDCRRHSGLTVTGQLDMGTAYDCFSELAHTDNPALPPEVLANRRLLREMMEKAGFRPYSKEWWHFTLRDEPFKKTYFDFVVR